MFNGVNRRDSLGWIQGNQLKHQVDSFLRHALDSFVRVDFSESWEGWFELWNLCDSRPVIFCGSSPELKDFEDLVYFGVTDKQGSFLIQLIEDTTNGPCVYT